MSRPPVVYREITRLSIVDDTKILCVQGKVFGESAAYVEPFL